MKSHGSGLLAALAATAVLATGCTVGPDPGPGIVHGDGGTDATTSTTVLPTLSVPARDLNYSECGPELAAAYRTSAPADLRIDCASFTVAIAPGDVNSSDIRVAVVRLRTAKTPADAAPLVLTTGTDVPSSRLALTFEANRLAPLLDAHPIVTVDRRGTGRSAPIDCLTTEQRETIYNDGAAGNSAVSARATALGGETRRGADLCNDTLAPDQLRFANADAAADLESLREYWEADRLGLVGVGSGSSVALAYLGAHPDRVARLVLDSPVGLNEQGTAAAATRAAGVQNSLAAFASRCA
ncbi:MAG: alpha/beta hydrolase, partial [Gordonia sp. (in: high G+C Gram-positive bacteria)]|uniref:alpha/beta fold hydrolase n=1 Tax=Gordonia sp. (in: high G+C Gram-positive bacteria) TaxID=84139 RepID=UPI003BB5D928